MNSLSKNLHDKENILCLDLGNSKLKIGFFKKNLKKKEIQVHKKLSLSYDKKNTHILEENIKSLLKKEIQKQKIKSIIYSSVVPSLNDFLENCFKQLFQIKKIYSIENILSFLDFSFPKGLGNDRISNCIASYELYAERSIIIDFGTAITLSYTSPLRNYVSGLILPGIQSSLESLSEKAENLPLVSFKAKKNLFPKSTKESMQSGIYILFLLILKKMPAILKKEIPDLKEAQIIITGGTAKCLNLKLKAPYIYDSDLCLKGLYIALDYYHSKRDKIKS